MRNEGGGHLLKPTVEAGISNHIWNIEEIIALMDEY